MSLLDYVIPIAARVQAHLTQASDVAPQALSEEIDQCITQARTQALESGMELNRFREGLFPVVAWADEALSRARRWGDEHAWQAFLLQRRYFKTVLAGREFFDRLDKLPEEDDALREIYLLCLCLGFQGRYGLVADAADLANVRIEQYRLLQKHDTRFIRTNDKLFPEAYLATTPKGAVGRSKRRRFTLRRVLFIVLPPLILIAVGLAMHTALTHAVQNLRAAIQL